jgi:hypothetical protein
VTNKIALRDISATMDTNPATPIGKPTLGVYQLCADAPAGQRGTDPHLSTSPMTRTEKKTDWALCAAIPTSELRYRLDA